MNMNEIHGVIGPRTECCGPRRRNCNIQRACCRCFWRFNV